MSEPNVVQVAFRNAIKDFRNAVPVLSFLDDTGIILLGYVIAWIVVYLICLLFKTEKSPDALDRRVLFDSRTKLKEQKIEIKKLRQSLPDKIEHDKLKHEYEELHQQLIAEQEDMQSLRSQLVDPEVLAEKIRTIEQLKVEKQEELDQLSQTKEAELLKMRREIEKLNEKLQDEQKTVDNLTTKNAELENSVQLHKESSAKLQQMYDETLSLLADQKQSDEDQQLSDASIDIKSTASKGSKQTESKNRLIEELKELASLKAELRRLQVEHGQASVKLQASQTEKKAFEERILHLKSELDKLHSKLDEENIQAEKHNRETANQNERLDKLLEMIKEKDQMISHARTEQDQLRSTISKLEAEIYKNEIAKQQSDQKIKILESDVEKAEEMKNKLQSRMFYDERINKSKVQELEETISKLQSGNVKASYETPNVISPNYERDYTHGMSDFPDLWSSFCRK